MDLYFDERFLIFIWWKLVSLKQPNGSCGCLHGWHNTVHNFSQGSSPCENSKQNKSERFGVRTKFVHPIAKENKRKHELL